MLFPFHKLNADKNEHKRPVPIYPSRKNTANMCFTIQCVVDCTQCGYRQRLGGPMRELCVAAAQGRICGRHVRMESRDQHVCGSCLEEQEEKAKREKEEAERKKREEEEKKKNEKKDEEEKKRRGTRKRT